MSFEDEDFKMAAVKSHDSGLVSHSEALNVLGVTAAADKDTVRNAFRQRLRTAHPDLNGGTDALLRRLILARDLLMSDDKISPQQTDILKSFEVNLAIRITLSIAEAMHGADVTLPESVLRVAIPHGVRDGEELNLITSDGTPALVNITVRPNNNCRLFGNDVWMSASIAPCIFKNGGTAIIETPMGAQLIRINANVAHGSSLCLKGRGLPAVRQHAVGDLYIRLEAATENVRPANEVLMAFRQRWAG